MTLLAHDEEHAVLREKLLAALRVEFSGEVIVFDPRDPVFGGPACSVAGCVLVGHGQGLCNGHHLQWRKEGRPAMSAFVATTDPRCFGRAADDAVPVFERQVSLSALVPGLRLEVQYLLQCRQDDQLARCSVPTVARMVRVLAGLPVTSLLDWDESRRRTSFGRPAPKDAGARALLIYGLGKLDELAFGRGWENEYPRDIWRLRHLGHPVGDGSCSNCRVSRSWLYGQVDLRIEIERLRERTRKTSPSVPARQRTSDASLIARLQAALKQCRKLTEENSRLRRQLAHALGDRRVSAPRRIVPEPPPALLFGDDSTLADDG